MFLIEQKRFFKGHILLLFRFIVSFRVIIEQVYMI